LKIEKAGIDFHGVDVWASNDRILWYKFLNDVIWKTISHDLKHVKDAARKEAGSLIYDHTLDMVADSRPDDDSAIVTFKLLTLCNTVLDAMYEGL